MAEAPKPPKAPKALVKALCSMSFIIILASAVKVAEERQITSLPVENIIHLLSSCLKRTQFAYNSTYMVMEDVEQRALVTKKMLLMQWEMKLSALSLIVGHTCSSLDFASETCYSPSPLTILQMKFEFKIYYYYGGIKEALPILDNYCSHTRVLHYVK